MNNLSKILSKFKNKLVYKLSGIDQQAFGINFLNDIRLIEESPGLSKYLNSGHAQHIIDVGANVGRKSIQFANEFPNSKIWSLEPIKKTYAELEENTRNWKNITPQNIALGSKSGALPIYIYDSSLIASAVAKSPVMDSRDSISTESCRVISLDDFVAEKKINEINLLKIDTEGYDCDVLIGAKQTLCEKKINFIYFEFFMVDDDGSNSTGGRLTDCHRLLLDGGFRPVTFYTDFIHSTHTAGGFNALYMRWR